MKHSTNINFKVPSFNTFKNEIFIATSTVIPRCTSYFFFFLHLKKKYSYKIYVHVIEFTKLLFSLSVFISCAPSSLWEVLSTKLIDERYRIQSLVELIDLVVWNFPLFFPETLANTGWNTLERPPTEGTSQQAQVPTADY